MAFPGNQEPGNAGAVCQHHPQIPLLQVEFCPFLNRKLKQPEHLISLKKASEEKMNVSSLEAGRLFLGSNMR